jgi:DNA-binding NtrC family response regulator
MASAASACNTSSPMADESSKHAVLIVGPENPVLEGLIQMFATAGVEARLASDAAEAAASTVGAPPLVAIVERSVAVSGAILGLELSTGGALILYRTSADDMSMVSPAVRRLTLAELTLPLERQRLFALVQSVVARARVRSERRAQTPPEHRAI